VVRRWDELQVGLTDGFEASFSAADVDAFAALCGDYNGLHLRDDAAQAAGFPGRVVHGMLASSLYSRLVGMHLPGEHSVLQQLEVKFRQPAFIGDRLGVSGEIVSTSEAARVIQVKAWIRRGETVLSTAAIRVGIRAAAFGPG
jgi:3-hydroxybutyryl-CoA dehydratase